MGLEPTIFALFRCLEGPEGDDIRRQIKINGPISPLIKLLIREKKIQKAIPWYLNLWQKHFSRHLADNCMLTVPQWTPFPASFRCRALQPTTSHPRRARLKRMAQHSTQPSHRQRCSSSARRRGNRGVLTLSCHERPYLGSMVPVAESRSDPHTFQKLYVDGADVLGRRPMGRRSRRRRSLPSRLFLGEPRTRQRWRGPRAYQGVIRSRRAVQASWSV